MLHDRLTAARSGRGGIVLISGEAGIGKTALAGVVGAAAVDAGARVLAGHCYDRTERPPYGPWNQIARRARPHSDDTSAAPLIPLDGAANQTDLFEQAHELLAALSAERPLVLVLEDLHWADGASLDLLRFIARRVEEMPLLLVGTYRAEDIDRHHPLTATIPLLVREAPTERLGLRPLDAAAAQELVRARHPLAEMDVVRVAAYLIERTDGNALFMTELLRSLEEDGVLDRLDGGSYAEVTARTPVPSLLRQIVEDRLVRLGDETVAQLVTAAVVGQEVPLAVWEAVTGTDEEALLTVAERAEAAHLLTAWSNGQGVRFTHALIRDVLYGLVPALRRRRIHRQVAEALMALPGPDPDAVASHLQLAGDERAAAWLTRAGERAEDAYALVTAAERYEAAFRLLDAQGGDAAERGWVRLLAASLRRHDDLDQAYEWTEEAVQLAATAGDPSLVARAQSLLGLLTTYRGKYAPAFETAIAAAELVDQLPPGTGAHRRREQQIDKIANRGTWTVSLAFGGRLAEARLHGEAFLARFVDGATTSGEHGAVADAHRGLTLTYALQGEPALAQRSYAAAVASYQASNHHLFALENLREELILRVLQYQADDLGERERIAAAAERLAIWVDARGRDANSNVLRDIRVPLLVLEGQWHAARAILDSADARDLLSIARLRPFCRAKLAMARGDYETAWRCVHEPSLSLPDAEPGGLMGSFLQLHFQLLAAELALDTGDFPAARGWLDLHHRWMDFTDAVLGRSEEAVLEAAWHHAVGDAGKARAFAEQALRHATTPRQPLALLAAHRMLGILATAAGDGAKAEAEFDAALALADACRAQYERALTLLARVEFAAARGDQATATVVLDEVRAICTPMEAFAVLARADRIAAGIAGEGVGAGGRAALAAGMTAREVEVLRLVAAGLSNAEIAERLFLSTNTVKVHVARILGKIGVNNRAGATEFALRNGIT